MYGTLILAQKPIPIPRCKNLHIQIKRTRLIFSLPFNKKVMDQQSIIPTVEELEATPNCLFEMMFNQN